jgi:pyridoxine 4-dehydrogenase
MNGTATLRFGDVEVQRIGLGTNRLRNTPANQAFLRKAVAAGVGHIDTAHTYTGGESEETIGAVLSPIPKDCIIATKGGWASGRPDAIRAEIEQSLRRLQTDSIPLYYLHRPDPEMPLEESLGAIKDYHDGGKIRHVGISNVTIDQIELARAVVPISAVQNNYSLSERRHDDVVDYCATEGIVFVTYFPLRFEAHKEALSEIAHRHEATHAQIALAWLLRRSPTVLTIPGTLTLDHLNENLSALEIELDDVDFRALRENRHAA